MKLLAGRRRDDDIERFLESVQEIGADTDSLVQAVDAAYVSSDDHLKRAVELARRSHRRDEHVADDPALEALLYFAGTRQIDRALELGVGPDTDAIAVVIEGGDEAHAASAVSELIEPLDPRPPPDRAAIRAWFDIGCTELGATTADIEELVLERVALLDVEK